MAFAVIAGIAAAMPAVITATAWSAWSWGAFALGAGLSMLSRALAPSLDMGGNTGSNITVREPAAPRKILYGQTRTGGAVVFLDTTGDENAYLHQVIAFAGHEIQEYEEVYFGKDAVWSNNNLLIKQSPFSTISGTPTVTVTADTNTARVGDIVTFSGSSTVAGLNLNNTFTVAAIGGSDPNYNYSFNAGANANATVSSVGGAVTEKRVGAVGDWWKYAEFNFHEGDQTTADSNLVSRSSKWNADNKLLGVAYIYIRLKYNQDKFSGLPNISALIKGRKVYNPTTGLTEWTQNPALCIRDYLVDDKYGLGENPDNIDIAALTNAITVCNQDVDVDGGGSQKRYTLNGDVNTAKSRKSNINDMLACMGGKLVYSGANYFIMPAYYQTPVVTIDESVLTAEIQIQTKQSRRTLYNGVKGSFISSEDGYIVADYPAQISSTYGVEDGDPIYLDMPLPYVTNNTQAQRIAKIALLQSRQQTTVTLPCNLAALKFKAGDTVMVTNAKMGWSQKVFEVLNYTLGASNDGGIVVNVNAIETAANIYDWATSDQEDFLTGGEINLYDGTVTQPPTSPVATNTVSITGDGTTVSEMLVSWTASEDVFVEAYEIEWSTDNVSFSGATTVSTSFTITPTIPAATYYIRVRAINNLGVKSTYATVNQTATGDTTAPALPTGLAATGGQGVVSLNWTNPADKDFASCLVYRSATSGGTYAVVANVAGTFGFFTEFTNSGLSDSTQYYYKLSSVDYSGNESAKTSAVNATTTAAGQQPRASNGYIYKTAASASTPSTPSATSYNYNTNTFGGLSSGWQVNPPTVTGADGKYWATSFTITEATYGGTQTITFSTPFSSFNFDGLVTFTNLNNELADPDSTEITTIDGGLIKTGKVEASRIEIDGTGIDTQVIGGKQTLIIGGGGVNSTKLASNAVTPVKIQDLAVTEGKIANLAVDTLKIANQAVTIPTSLTSTGTSWNGTTAEQSIATLTWTGTGAATELLWRYYAVERSPFLLKVRVKHNGSQISLNTFTGGLDVIDAINIVSTSGTNTVEITGQKTSGTTTGGAAVTSILIRALELKK